MKNKIPVPIMTSIIKVLLCCTGMTLVGVICAVISSDYTLFLLSAIVLGIGIVRANNLRKQAQQKDYVLLEGTLIGAKELNLQNKVNAYFSLSDGTEKKIRISGKIKLKGGAFYRLYLTKPIEGCEQWSLPEYLKPAQNILGYEILEPEDALR